MLASRVVLIACLGFLAAGLTPLAAALGPAFHESWESPSFWTCYAAPGPMLVTSVGAPDGPTAQVYDHVTTGGDCLGPEFHMNAGDYCISSWIRWDSGGWPFVGLEPGDHWYIGDLSSDPTITPVPANAVGWNWYSHDITVTSGTYRIQNELWATDGKGGPNLGYFDGIDVSPGACPAGPSTPTPELGSLALGLAGLIGLGAFVWVRRN